MKKLMTLAALVAACAPAFTAEVTSSNTVGYTKVNLSAGLNLLGAQFVDIGQTDVAIATIAKLTGQATYDEEGDPQTELRIWTGTGYSKYEWTGSLSTDNPDVAEVLAEDLEGADTGAYDNKFLYAYEPTEDTVPAGKGFWIWASHTVEKAVTFSGEVPSTNNNVTVSLTPGLNLVSYPWPVAAPLSSIKLTGQATYDEDGDPQTELRIWTGTGYSKYEWTGNLSTENPDVAAALAEDLEGADTGAYDNVFLYGYEPTDTSIPVGTGFWIWASGSGTIVFTHP